MWRTHVRLGSLVLAVALPAVTTCVLLSAAPAAAAAFVVTTTNDADRGNGCLPGDCTFREAVRASNDNEGSDTITFAVAANGTIILGAAAETVDDSGTLTIIGNGPASTIISGNNARRVLEFNNTSFALQNLTLTNGKSTIGGAFDVQGNGTVPIVGSFDHVVVSNSTTTGPGGGITVGGSSGAVVTIANSLITGNSASGNGGGVAMAGATLAIINSTIAGNTAATGAGLNIIAGTVSVQNSVFANTGNDCGGTPTFQYSVVDDASCGAITGVNGNKIGNPALNADFSLPPGSIAIDAGSNTLIAGATTDVAGKKRIQNGTVDMGALEAAPPAPAITSPVDGSHTIDTTPTITGTAVANASVTVTVDGVPGAPTPTNGSGAWSFTTGTLTEAGHTVSATVIETNGNQSPSSATIAFTVDITPPPAPVVVNPAHGAEINGHTPDVTGTAEADAEVTVVIDGTPAGTVGANGAGAWVFGSPALAEGSHTVRAIATDAAGNTSVSSNTNTFAIDTTAPAAPSITAPADGESTTDSTPTVEGLADVDTTIVVTVDGTVAGTTLSGIAGLWNVTTASLGDGAHTVMATATDTAGNTSAASATTTFNIDTTAPVAPTVASPTDGSITNDATPAVSGSAEPHATLTVTIDGAPAGAVAVDGAGAWTLVAAALSDGTHTVSAFATDVLGNVSPTSATNTFEIDTTAPPAPIVGAPIDGSIINDSTPTLSGTAAPGGTVQLTMDSSQIQALRSSEKVVASVVVAGDGSWSVTMSAPLADGQHTLSARQVDAAGNQSAARTVGFVIDTTPPAPPVVTPPGTVTTDPTPTITGTGDPGTTVTVLVDGVLVGTTVVGADGTWSLTLPALTDGPHTITVTATDPAGNTSTSSTSVSVAIDTTPPTVPTTTTPVTVPPAGLPETGGSDWAAAQRAAAVVAAGAFALLLSRRRRRRTATPHHIA